MPLDVVLDPAVDPALLPAMIVPARTALLIIDVQEDFVSPAGAAGRWGVDLGVFAAPIGRIQALIAAARAAGVTAVVFDRGSYMYHGRGRALAEAAREAGLAF